MMQTDFLESPLPKPQALDLDLTTPARFVNREISWLGFNWRVLEEAENPRVPLLERLRFLSISATNLDEFYTVRVAGLRELAHEGSAKSSIDGRTPAEQLVEIDRNARALMQRQQEVFRDMRAEMASAGMVLMERDALTDIDKAFLDDVFLDQVFPDRMLCQWLWAAAQEGQRLYQLCRLDGAKPEPTGGDPDRDHQQYGQSADRQSDHGSKLA